LYLLLAIIAATNYTLWLVMVRCLLDGETYEWAMRFGLSGLRGQGLEGGFWLLPLMAAFVLVMIHLGSAGARGPFAAMFFGWYGVHCFAAMRLAARLGEKWRFRGDTLGIDVRLDLVMPALYVIVLLMGVAWLWLSRDHRPAPVNWSRWNFRLLAVAAGMIPLQFALLRFGEPHGLTDQIGVLLTVTQWFVICTAIALPKRPLSP
jgi:hypothetical protein